MQQITITHEYPDRECLARGTHLSSLKIKSFKGVEYNVDALRYRVTKTLLFGSYSGMYRVPREYYRLTICLFSESAPSAPPWHLRGSHFDNASVHYLRNGPAFLWFLARPLLFLFLLVLPVVS